MTDQEKKDRIAAIIKRAADFAEERDAANDSNAADAVSALLNIYDETAKELRGLKEYCDWQYAQSTAHRGIMKGVAMTLRAVNDKSRVSDNISKVLDCCAGLLESMNN